MRRSFFERSPAKRWNRSLDRPRCHHAALGVSEPLTLVFCSYDDNRWLVGHKSYKWVSFEDLILVRVSIQHALPSSAYLLTRDRRAAVDRID
jgi:hypothetical protein